MGACGRILTVPGVASTQQTARLSKELSFWLALAWPIAWISANPPLQHTQPAGALPQGYPFQGQYHHMLGTGTLVLQGRKLFS